LALNHTKEPKDVLLVKGHHCPETKRDVSTVKFLHSEFQRRTCEAAKSLG
jgi:hypothetical protein